MKNKTNKQEETEIELANKKGAKIPTKQKILFCAVDWFSTKGYASTTIRDISASVGINSASLYSHFSSKEEILQFMLNDFADRTQTMFNNPEMPSILRKEPTAEGVLSCMQISLSVLSDEYYSKVLHVLYHEQHHNTIIRNYIAKTIIDIEAYVEKIITILKSQSIIRSDADPDFWKKITSSLLYAFPDRMMLGIEDNAPDFSVKDLEGLLFYLFEMLFQIHGDSR